MQYMLALLNESKAHYSADNEKYSFTEEDLIQALEYVYDKGMDWAYQLVEYDIKALHKGNKDAYN